MAKNPTVFTFARSELRNTSFANIWVRLPDFNFGGFDGSLTLSRVRLTYTLGGDVGVDSNGILAERPYVGIALTTGSPPSAPAQNPFDRTNTDQILYVECPKINGFVNGAVGLRVGWQTSGGEIDLNAQRRIPASPGAAALWIGVEIIDQSGAPVTRNIQRQFAGMVVRLDGLGAGAEEMHIDRTPAPPRVPIPE